jgi:hypothetical protein
MRVELPSGAWVELRDKLNVEDQRAVQNAVVIEITTDENGNTVQRIPGDHTMARRAALLSRIVTDWSFAAQGIPIPSQNVGGADMIDSAISDLDDMNKLDEEIRPLMEKANPGRRPNSRRPSAS